MRILFMGTPDFAVPSLRCLCEDGHEVCAVFTQPDKPQGRKQIITPPPVKQAAFELRIPVFQPVRLRDEEVIEQIRALEPALIVVVAYGKLLPQAVLSLPQHGCINVHGSLLPKYRGAAPIQRAVIEGETVTGVTTMQMDVGMDTGDILLKREVPVYPDETGGELYNRLSHEGAQALRDTLEMLSAGNLTPIQQDDALASHAAMLTKDDSPIDWLKPAGAVHNQVRGLNPWPSAQTVWNGKVLKIHKTALSDTRYPGAEPGTVVSLSPPTVACGDGGTIVLLEVQPAGGKRMRAEDFLRGSRLEAGMRLGV